jgi:hypothetical protein
MNRRLSNSKLVKSLYLLDDNLSLLNSVVKGDDTWCFQYDLQTKRKHVMMLTKPFKTQNFLLQKSKNKVMLVTFLDSQGVIHKELVPPGQMVNKECYMEILSRLVQRIHLVRPQFEERGTQFLLHDNVRPHIAVSIKHFGKKKDSRIKSLPSPIFSLFITTRCFLSPQNQIHAEREKI